MFLIVARRHGVFDRLFPNPLLWKSKEIRERGEPVALCVYLKRRCVSNENRYSLG